MNKYISLPQAAAALLLTIAASGAWCAAPTTNATSPGQAKVALTVTVTAAAQAQWPTNLEANGAVAPWQEAIIAAQNTGLQLTELRVNVGDNVKRGQLLAAFDADLLRTDEVRLEASWKQAQANRERALQLQQEGGISEQDVLQYTTQADVAKAQLQYTLLQLRYAQVLAPDDGVISARSATLGAVANSGQELFRMIRQSRLEWRGELTATQMAQVKVGQRVDLSLPDGTVAKATIRQLAPTLESQTRLGIAYADIHNAKMVRSGMYVKGKIALADKSAVIVPAASVVIRDGRSYVPKLMEGNRIALQAVTVGRQQDNAVEVTAGLLVGEKVVVQGAGFLKEGDLVRVVAATTTVKE